VETLFFDDTTVYNRHFQGPWGGESDVRWARFFESGPQTPLFQTVCWFWVWKYVQDRIPERVEAKWFSEQTRGSEGNDQNASRAGSNFGILASWHQLGCLAAGWYLGILAPAWLLSCWLGPGPRDPGPRPRALGEGPGPRAQGQGQGILVSWHLGCCFLMSGWLGGSTVSNTLDRNKGRRIKMNKFFKS